MWALNCAGISIFRYSGRTPSAMSPSPTNAHAWSPLLMLPHQEHNWHCLHPPQYSVARKDLRMHRVAQHLLSYRVSLPRVSLPLSKGTLEKHTTESQQMDSFLVIHRPLILCLGVIWDIVYRQCIAFLPDTHILPTPLRRHGQSHRLCSSGAILGTAGTGQGEKEGAVLVIATTPIAMLA